MSTSMYRQGDILLIKEEEMRSLSASSAAIVRIAGKIVLAYGEKTGHAHTISSPNAVLYQDGGTRFLRVINTLALLEHQEHDTLKLPKGDYHVIQQREYEGEGRSGKVYHD